MALVLGTVAFQDWELPEAMPFGGSHRLKVHRLIGGRRVIDALGPDDAPLTWKGRFRGPLATLRARQLDTMRRAGEEHVLSYDTFCYRVVIASFTADFERSTEIPYSLTCEVLEDLVAGFAAETLDSVESAITGDLADALGLSVDSPIVSGLVVAGAATITGAASTGTLNLSTLGGAAMAGLQGGIATTIAQAGSVSKAASEVLSGSPLESVLAGPVDGMGDGVRSIVDAGEIAWRATGVGNVLSRVAGNLVA